MVATSLPCTWAAASLNCSSVTFLPKASIASKAPSSIVKASLKVGMDSFTASILDLRSTFSAKA